MTTTEELRVTITGPENHVESYINELHKTVGEGERHGVQISIERVETESMHTEGFSKANE